MDTSPSPQLPPCGALIEVARKGARLTIQAAAKRAGVSKATWIDSVREYRKRDGSREPVDPKPETIARMAHAVGVSAKRLEIEGEHPDAAEILTEILRREPVSTEPAPVLKAETPAPRYDNRTLEYLWHTPGLTGAQCEVLINMARTWVEPAAAAYEQQQRA